jgi:hypothetical protein
MGVLVFSLSFLFAGVANAETVTLQKALIFSADNSSDYKLPEVSGSVYALKDFIATSGQITGITVNWKSSGAINFEVSADNGLHYYSVVNGAPLKNNFVNGDRLRWRATTLSDDAKLTAVNINYTDTAGVSANFGEPELSGFLYRKEISIEKSKNEDLYNYQLKLKIGENESVKNVDFNLGGRTLADFKDIRFAAADGQTPLPYYIEALEGETGSRVATVWVRVPQIPKAGVILYLYYGNDTAESLSNPNATFDFYEDFTAASLDKNKWVVHTEQKGSASLTKGAVKLDAAEIITKEFQFKEGIIEYSCSSESGFENSLNIRNKNEESYDSPIWLAYASIYKGAEHCIAVDGIVKVNDPLAKLAVAGEKYNYRVTLDSGKITFERFEMASGKMGQSPSGTVPIFPMTELQASAAYDIDPMPKAGYLSLRSGGDGGGKNIINFGALRVRKAAAYSPVHNIGKEERVALPIFVDTKLSSYGNITLKDTATSGYYVSSDIAAADGTVRIIIPTWKVEPADKTTVKVSVSADGGANYKKECENAKYYYVSKKDFSAGLSLKARLDISRQNTGENSLGISEVSLDYRPGKITVTAPAGGESWTQGNQKISWSALDYEVTYPIKLEYSLDLGKSYKEIVEKTDNYGEYFWDIPSGSQSRRAVIRVSDGYDNSINSVSRKPFAITLAQGTQENIQKIEAPLTAEELAKRAKENAELARVLAKAKNAPGVKSYELLIKTSGSADPNPLSYRAGDIVMIKPAGFKWSETEKSGFLILTVDLDDEAIAKLLSPRQIESGKKDKKGNSIMYTTARRSSGVDLSKFDLSQKSGDKGKPAVRRYLKNKVVLSDVLRAR